MCIRDSLYACGVDYVGVSSLFTFMESMPAYWKPYLEIIKAIWYDKDVIEEKEIMDLKLVLQDYMILKHNLVVT